MKKKWKQTAAAVLLTMLLYLLFPMLGALLAVNEWADTENLLLPMLMAAGGSSAVGTLFLVRKGKWSVFSAALLTGVGVQFSALLAGYLIFGSAAMDGQRWLLPVTGLVSGLSAGIFLGQKKGRKKDARRARQKRR